MDIHKDLQYRRIATIYMCVYTYVYTYTYMYMYIHMYIHTYILLLYAYTANPYECPSIWYTMNNT